MAEEEKSIWEKIGDGVVSAAPGIAKAVASFVPGGSAVVGAIEAVSSLGKAFGLGDNPEPDALAKAIAEDPQAALKIRQAEMDYQLKLRDQELAALKEQLNDMQDARARDLEMRKMGKPNYRADIMLIAAFVAVIVIAIVLAQGGVEAASAIGGFLITMGGMFARNIGTAFDFEFGSSRSSLEKSEALFTFAGKK